MLLYSDAITFLTAIFDPTVLPTFDPGPPNENRLKVTPDRLVFVSIGSGPGIHGEALYDRTMIAIRSAGPQGDFAGAEAQALAIDAAFTALDRSGMMGSARVNGVSRAGGRPAFLGQDTADRYHFTCSYVADAATR